MIGDLEASIGSAKYNHAPPSPGFLGSGAARRLRNDAASRVGRVSRLLSVRARAQLRPAAATAPGSRQQLPDLVHAGPCPHACRSQTRVRRSPAHARRSPARASRPPPRANSQPEPVDRSPAHARKRTVAIDLPPLRVSPPPTRARRAPGPCELRPGACALPLSRVQLRPGNAHLVGVKPTRRHAAEGKASGCSGKRELFVVVAERNAHAFRHRRSIRLSRRTRGRRPAPPRDYTEVAKIAKEAPGSPKLLGVGERGEAHPPPRRGRQGFRL